MALDIQSDCDSNPEQITRYNTDVSSYVYNTVKQILAEDEFGVLNLRVSLDLDKKTNSFNSRIEKLLQSYSKGKTQKSTLFGEVKKLRAKNEKSLELIKDKLNAN